MANPTIEDKIKNLLALSQNAATEHEASAAAGIAAGLAEKHRIDIALLDGIGEAEEPVNQADAPLYTSKRKSSWKVHLAGAIAKNNNCKMFYDPENEWYRGRWVIKQTKAQIIGSASDVQVVRYLFAYLTSELTRLSQDKCKGQGKAVSNSYLIGAVDGIAYQLDASKREARRNVSSTALVKIDQGLVKAKEEMNRLYPNSKNFNTGGASNSGAYNQGKNDGKNIHLGKSLGGRKLLNK